MRWLLKAATQKVFSALPNGEKFNYFFQRNITKSLPFSDTQFFQKFSQLLRHWKIFSKYAKTDNLSKSVFYEFGAGQDLIMPFSYYALGVSRQTIIDISESIRIDLLNNTINKFLEHKEKLQQIADRTLCFKNFRPLSKKNDLLNYFGINYIVPADARKTNFAPGSFDFISNTFVLEHIPPSDISPILNECYRILKPNGIMSCIVDMQDHYSYFDNGISIYNFLKFPNIIWNFINSSLHYQNRLRYPDYIDVFNKSGFTTLEENVDYPSPDELEKLKSIKLAEKFKKGYSLEELGIKFLHVVSGKS